MENQLRNAIKKLLEEKTVGVAIGYGPVGVDGAVGAVFAASPEEADQFVWNADCVQNLAVHLTRPEVKALGKPAVVVNERGARAVVLLCNEAQIKREDVVIVAINSSGTPAITEYLNSVADVVLEGPVAEDKTPDARTAATRKQLEELRAMSSEERFAFWRDQFSRCVRCYACRQSCPLCYCNRCVADKNRPTRIDTSASLKGNFAWNILRAFHLAGRCVGCGACSQACPAGIPLHLLNLTLADAAKENYGFVSGMELGAAPLIGSYAPTDKEEFIR